MANNVGTYYESLFNNSKPQPGIISKRNDIIKIPSYYVRQYTYHRIEKKIYYCCNANLYQLLLILATLPFPRRYLIRLITINEN